MLRNISIFLALVATIAGIAIFGQTQSSSAVSQSPWITQSFSREPGDAEIISAFNNLPAVALKDSLPGLENSEVVKCQQLRCLVDVPGWSLAIVVGGYDVGEVFAPTATEGHALILYNIGEAKASFGYAALGPSYVVIVPYPDGRPAELASLTVAIAGYLAKIGLNPDRTSSKPLEWNNQCAVRGCSSVRIGGYLFANAERAEGARFIHYFRTTVSE